MFIFFALPLRDGWNLSDLKEELPEAGTFTDNLSGLLIESQWEDFDSDSLYFCSTWSAGPALFWGFDLTQPPQIGSTVSIPDAYWQGCSDCVVTGVHYESSNCVIVDCVTDWRSSNA